MDSGSFWGTDVSDMQDDVTVGDGAITGTLKYLEAGQLVTDWGEGYFMALQFSDFDETADSVLVGLQPSVSSGLADVLADPDHNGVFKVTDKDKQKFVVVTVAGDHKTKVMYDLSGLTLE